MPLPNRVIRNELDVVDGKLYASSNSCGFGGKSTVLQDIGEAKLLGCYEQISLLGSYAAQIFQDIVRDIDDVNLRAEEVGKSEALVAAVSEVSKAALARQKRAFTLRHA